MGAFLVEAPEGCLIPPHLHQTIRFLHGMIHNVIFLSKGVLLVHSLVYGPFLSIQTGVLWGKDLAYISFPGAITSSQHNQGFNK